MEPAIPPHLRCPRSLSRRVPDDYAPPFATWVGRQEPSVQQSVMAYLGVQYAHDHQRPGALAAVRHIVGSFSAADGPKRHDVTDHVDAADHHNLMVVGYWDDAASYCRWLRSAPVVDWWSSADRLTEGLGYFREITAPTDRQLETLYAFREDLPGVGALMPTTSGEIDEHGYWGSMRDRFPASQDDWMSPTGELTVVEGDPAAGGRVAVRGHDNIAIIRSGQDWRSADAEERALYLDEIRPTLVAGMDFLRDHGQDVGCYSNRFVQRIDLDGNLLDETYNVGHWRPLEKLERWAEAHPTHLRIFTTFFRVVTVLKTLRLYHEVSVSDGAEQLFEYTNCHPATGMLRDARVPTTA